MTISLFEAPLDTAESTQLDVPISTRILSAGLASLVAILPAVAAAICAYRVSSLFRSMTNAETASESYVTAGLHTINTPLVVALGIAALLAFVIALVQAVNPKLRLASVGFPFSIAIPFIAAFPAMLLWSAETSTLEIFSGRPSGMESIAETAYTVSVLLLGALFWGLITVGVTSVCALVSLIFPISKRTEPLALRRAFIWAVTGVLLLVFAGAYAVVV